MDYIDNKLVFQINLRVPVTISLDEIQNKYTSISNEIEVTRLFIVSNAKETKQRLDILNKTNEYRKTNGLEALVLDESLSKVAMLRAMEIAYSGNATHTRPNGSEWTTMWTEYGAKDQYTRMAENIAGEYETDLEACEGWHNQNHTTQLC